jgi:tagaturonate reductase
MKCRKEDGKYIGSVNGSQYPVEDDRADYYAEKWKANDINKLVDEVLADREFWEVDLTSLNGFAEAIKINLHSLMQNGAMATLQNLTLNKTVV